MTVDADRSVQVDVTSRHFKAPETLKTYVEEEIRKLSRYYDRALSYRVILTEESSQRTAEILVNAKGRQFTVVERDQEMDRAVAQAIEKLKGQLKRHKEKIVSR